ncbi:MAG: PD-(D/E)XK nuclease family transposase, partial [Clostridiales bacterium]|nr:PD-(D/E)XK nuclease family transposase [Clostridiales bacterium]
MTENIVIPEILPPSDDRVFKSLMTHPDGEPVLRGVMSDVLDMQFVSVEVRNVEPPISDINEKQQRFDVNCCAVADSGKQIAAEMQAEPMKGDNAETEHRNIKSRAIRGVCDLYADQPGRGTAYSDFEQSFQITFCGYAVFPKRTDFIRRFSFRDADGAELANDVGIVFIELTKLGEVLKKPVKDMTRLEQWCVFFGCADNPKCRDILNKLNAAREDIRMATELLASISRDERERALFRSRRIAQLDMEHNYAVAR